jgi:hypothetical protein
LLARFNEQGCRYGAVHTAAHRDRDRSLCTHSANGWPLPQLQMLA